MSDSPITSIFRHIDALDVDGVTAMFAPDSDLVLVYGREAHGRDQVHAALAELVAGIRATHHETTAEWNPEPGLWIAELTATYELLDYGRIGPYRRAAVLHESAEGVTSLSIYGAHEGPLASDERGYQEVRAGGRWMPTL
jgi:hypothetical protein